MPKSVLIPITNVYANGAYCAQISIGSENATANLILDTGSSTLVVQREDYDPNDDQNLVPTKFAQSVTYGMGGWFGPVVKTNVKLGHGDYSVEIEETHIAVAKKEQQQNFFGADGILGLGYYQLNRAHDISDYLSENNVHPQVTYPWILAEEQQDDTVREFKTFLRDFPESYITPYFTELAKNGVVCNRFAFLVHRSSVYHSPEEKPLDELKKMPINQGWFILGDPHEHDHLFEGDFTTIKVHDKKFYNIKVHSLQVGDCAPRKAPELKEVNRRYRTNGIIDTGASAIVLPKCLFDQMCEDLASINPKLEAIIEPYKTFEGIEEGVCIDLVNLDEWPTFTFTVEGLDGEPVSIELHPEHYWQMHAPKPNQASFQFVFLPNWPNQCILGLPIMNHYFTVFDRRIGDHGAILLAQKNEEHIVTHDD